MISPLKLYARDGADIEVMSAHLQDAVLQIGDMAYLADERRFVLLANRYCWEYDKTPMRVRAALQIAGVTSIQHTRLDMKRRDSVVPLLAMQMQDEGESGIIMQLVFSGGGEIRLEVEVCEVILEDITAPWGASSQPAHEGP